MKYFPLIWSGLWRKPLRTIFTLLSVIVAFVLFGVLQGIDDSFARMTAASHLDILYVDPRFGVPLPVSYRQQIANVPGVSIVALREIMYGYYQDPKNGVVMALVDDSYFDLRPEWTITKEQIATLRKTRDGLVITSAAAKKFGWKVGDRISITSNNVQKDGSKNWTFEILAIFDNRDISNYYYVAGNYEYVDEGRAAGAGTLSRFLLQIKDPNRAAQIGKQIDKLFINSSAPTRTQPEKTFMQSTLNSAFDIGFFTKSVLGAVFFTLLFMTANTIMQSVRERIPEFAVLKAIGYSDVGVVALVLSESMLLCVMASFVGLGLAMAFATQLSSPLAPFLGSFQSVLQVTPATFLYGMGIALVVAIVSGLLPAWQAKRLVIIDALAGR